MALYYKNIGQTDMQVKVGNIVQSIEHSEKLRRVVAYDEDDATILLEDTGAWHDVADFALIYESYNGAVS